MAYLNYIYANDLANEHFCQAMLLMSAQVPAGTANPFVALFTPEHAVATMGALADVQAGRSTWLSHAAIRPQRRCKPRSSTLRAIVE